MVRMMGLWRPRVAGARWTFAQVVDTYPNLGYSHDMGTRHVHVRRRGRERATWCGAPARGFMLQGLDHAAELSSGDPQTQACPRCAVVAAAAVLAGAQLERVPA